MAFVANLAFFNRKCSGYKPASCMLLIISLDASPCVGSSKLGFFRSVGQDSCSDTVWVWVEKCDTIDGVGFEKGRHEPSVCSKRHVLILIKQLDHIITFHNSNRLMRDTEQLNAALEVGHAENLFGLEESSLIFHTSILTHLHHSAGLRSLMESRRRFPQWCRLWARAKVRE